ncbi:MAG TPA: SDR family oxidoreductase [Verrucomicrobiae bacterium]|nr:SDR family oxidoreductase [Verrucomicrobiae bacterium]
MADLAKSSAVRRAAEARERSRTPRVALVTGGTSGIGLATARRLGGDGFAVAITGRDLERGQGAERELRRVGVEARFVAADARDSVAAASVVREIESAWGRLDVLVASAGVGVVARVIDTPGQLVQEMLATNVIGALVQVQACRALLGRSRPSAVVLVSSDSGIRGDVPLGAYSVTKAAVNMLGRMLALDLVEEGVRVNVVCPGDTIPGMRHMGTLADPESSSSDPSRWTATPMGRYADADEVAAVIGFLSQSQSSYVNGAVLLVDGGASAGMR